MSKLRVTVQEARHLFHNFEKDLRRICEEEFREFEGSYNNESNGDDLEGLWEAVDKEFRTVYESSRYGLEVQDLDEDATDLDIFRGFCEDTDGMEPRDGNLINRISRETQAIQDLLEHNALYRISIPAKIEEYFTERVQAKRKLFDDLLLDKQPRESELDDTNLSDILPPPESLGKALEALNQRLRHSSAVLESVLG